MIYRTVRVYDAFKSYGDSTYHFSSSELKEYLLGLHIESDEVFWTGIEIDEIDAEDERVESFCFNHWCSIRQKMLTDQEWLDGVHEWARKVL